jgi:hypothetical protein
LLFELAAAALYTLNERSEYYLITRYRVNIVTDISYSIRRMIQTIQKTYFKYQVKGKKREGKKDRDDKLSTFLFKLYLYEGWFYYGQKD